MHSCWTGGEVGGRGAHSGREANERLERRSCSDCSSEAETSSGEEEEVFQSEAETTRGSELEADLEPEKEKPTASRTMEDLEEEEEKEDWLC